MALRVPLLRALQSHPYPVHLMKLTIEESPNNSTECVWECRYLSDRITHGTTASPSASFAVKNSLKQSAYAERLSGVNLNPLTLLKPGALLRMFYPEQLLGRLLCELLRKRRKAISLSLSDCLLGSTFFSASQFTSIYHTRS